MIYSAMSDDHTTPLRHVIAALVTNEPGVLANVAGMFAARGFNIDSLVVGRTENPELSRMTIVVTGGDLVIEQVRKQLQKLIPVVKVVDYSDIDFVERDLMLVQVATASKADATSTADGGPQNSIPSSVDRSEIVELANLFRARIVDVSQDRLMIELSGTEDKLEAFIKMVEPYGIVELARTGVIAMPRGHADRDHPLRTASARRRGASPDNDQGPKADPKDLPPG